MKAKYLHMLSNNQQKLHVRFPEVLPPPILLGMYQIRLASYPTMHFTPDSNTSSSNA